MRKTLAYLLMLAVLALPFGASVATQTMAGEMPCDDCPHAMMDAAQETCVELDCDTPACTAQTANLYFDSTPRFEVAFKPVALQIMVASPHYLSPVGDGLKRPPRS